MMDSGYLSPTPSNTNPGWAPPRTPLTPQRLAKLANALGVSTPLPATQPPTPLMTNNIYYTRSATGFDQFRRPSTPSSASIHNSTTYSQTTSKFLLHVIPPSHLPHSSDINDPSFLTPPPAAASGYHTQFMRGTLVAMHCNFQSQLLAIAKEYALPSTAGMILYLVTANSRPSTQSGDSFGLGGEEPGPRLSEDIWKHLWNRVVKAEQEENLASTRSPTPHLLGLGLSIGSPFGAPTAMGGHVLPIPTPRRVDTPLTASSFAPASPTSLSSLSDLRSHTKSAPPSSSSISQSEPETPDTSSASHSPADETKPDGDAFDLPGLHSNSIIPILAKVEFDIDRQKAAWYDPWLRSRRMNHAKREEIRSEMRSVMGDESVDGDEESSQDRRPPLDLHLVNRLQTSSPLPNLMGSNNEHIPVTITGRPRTESPEPVVSVADEDRDEDEESDPPTDEVGYEPLSESSDSSHTTADGVDERNLSKNILTKPGDEDPLQDVFGTDAETWVGLNSVRGFKRQTNPDVVELALNASQLLPLSDGPSFEEDWFVPQDEKQEVQELLDTVSRPHLSVVIPTSSEVEAARPTSPTTAGPVRKHIPPPLVLNVSTSPGDQVLPLSPAPPSTAGSTRLAYLNGEGIGSAKDASDHDEPSSPYLDEPEKTRSPSDEKRVGILFEDLDFDLGLDFEDDEFDEDDPHDRRKSQYALKARLDEIEKNLQQFSPKVLENHLDNDIPSLDTRSASLMHSPGMPPSPGNVLLNAHVFPPSPSVVPRTPESAGSIPARSWPALPYSVMDGSAQLVDAPPSTPQFALNGVVASAPKSYLQNSRPPSSAAAMSPETEIRKRELEEHEALYTLVNQAHKQLEPSPPVIPLSPDPFGRFSSAFDIQEDEPQPHPVASVPVPRRRSNRTPEPQGSRFSTDSADALAKAGKTLINVKGIKNLWRKSGKDSISEHASAGPSKTAAQRVSTHLAQLSPARGSQEQQLSVPLPQRSPLPSPTLPAKNLQHHRGGSSINELRFDQESPYPVHRNQSDRYLSRTQPAPPPVPPLPERGSVRKSIMKSWKSTSGSISQNLASSSEPGSSGMDRQRSFRGSTMSPDIPPSPQIPEHFMHSRMNGVGEHQRQSHSSKKTTSSTDSSNPVRPSLSLKASPPPHRPSISEASSIYSEDTRPSFDSSQFEMVSPRIIQGGF